MELLGKRVRCPHCKQVVLAPSATGISPPKPPTAAKPEGIHDFPTPVKPSSPPPAPPTSPQPEPLFNFPQKETAESILSEPTESEDEIFGSHPTHKMSVPVFPVVPPDAPPPPPPPPTPPVPAPPEPPPTQVATVSLPSPFVLQDAVPPPAAQPPATTTPASENAPPTAAANPWAGLGEGAAHPAPVAPAQVILAPAAGAATPAPPSKPELQLPQLTPAPLPSQSGVPRTLFLAVVAYALIVTVFAVYGLFIKSSTKLPPDHPLSTIPDTFGEFDPASRKKVTQYKFPVDEALPPNSGPGWVERSTSDNWQSSRCGSRPDR